LPDLHVYIGKFRNVEGCRHCWRSIFQGDRLASRNDDLLDNLYSHY
jgi:hypothetical protein